MFPTTVILFALDQRDARGSRTPPMATVKHIVLNPMVISNLIGMLWSVLDLHMPGPVVTYLSIFDDALTPCALFAIGLGLSIDRLRAIIGRSLLLSAVKLVIMPGGGAGAEGRHRANRWRLVENSRCTMVPSTA
jgi:hypothetical protein